ncbi:hypothetical protein [Hellea balneolensis]|uniref:hypothetical protein n=1 Tax=Hellea balneolensis TaxID=287478 RepID=UPI00047890F6|nr:hypothetical protein [Hellea balneolensis]
MESLLNLAILIGIVGPIGTHYLLRKNFEGRYFSRAYIRNFTWGLRRLIFPAISIYILLATNLRTFCVALFCFSLVSLGLKLILGSKESSRKIHLFTYFSYVFLFLTWANNEPYWIQIWPTILWSVGLIFILICIVLDKPLWLMPNWPTPIQRSVKLMMQIMFTFSAFILVVGNEFFRQNSSFEVWAIFNAFSMCLLVAFIGLCTVIIIPAIGDERLEKFDKEHST